MSRSEEVEEEEEEEAELLLFVDEPFEDLDEDAFEDLAQLETPSAGSKANTISWKWPRNSESLRKASFH